MANTVTYELPLNERTRLFLRLEHLFNQSAQGLEEGKNWAFHLSLNSLCEILNILDRIDIKSEALQETDKIRNCLFALQDNPQADLNVIEKVVKRLNDIHTGLLHFSLTSLPSIRKNEFLTQLRQRLKGPGSPLSYDFPAYHHWLHCSNGEKVAQLRAWLEDLAPISEAIYTLLELVRSSGMKQRCLAQQGRYHQQFEKGHQLRLVRLHLEQEVEAYPEMSGNRHRMNVRFFQSTSDTPKSELTKSDIPFDITFCKV
ncbi:MAG: cell division protein ZapD [Legionellales bacterium]|nr:cell division protein ZapD [Legionellales bacterium]|tara:strand:- start:1780 stop:2550 length:771 start_codon:yes stop_codon:yes gene_type:complete